MKRWPLLAPALAGLAASLSAPTLARAETKAECIAANTTAQDLRRDGKLAAARAQLRKCAESSCPAMVRDDCARRLDDLERVQPTLVFGVKDAAGNDLIAVRVSVDGDVLAEKLDGKAIPVDPGPHEFAFEAAGQPPVKKTLLIKEGEKERSERIVLRLAPAESSRPVTPPPAPQAPPSRPSSEASPRPEPSPAPSQGPEPASDAGPSPAHGSPLRTIGFVTGAVGLAGLAAGGVFGVLATAAWNNAKSECSSPTTCPDHQKSATDHDAAVTDGTLSTVSFVAGGALVVTGVVLVLAGAGHSDVRASGLVVTPAFGAGFGGVGVSGGF